MLEVILFKLEKSRMYLFANNEEFEDFIKDLDTNKFQLTIRPQGFYGTEKNCDDGDNVKAWYDYFPLEIKRKFPDFLFTTTFILFFKNECDMEVIYRRFTYKQPLFK